MQLQLPLGDVATENLTGDNPVKYEATKYPERVIDVVELLVPAHDDDIIRLTKKFVQDVDLNEWVDEEVLKLSCIRIRNDVERRYTNCFLAYQRGELIGFLVGVTSPCFHRRGIVAEQKLCYVIPTRRGSMAAVKLLKSFELWARMNGATQIFTGTANMRYAERTAKFFQKLGYSRVGSLHVKEV